MSLKRRRTARFDVYILVMWSLERIYDSDPTPAIVSPVSTAAKSEPLVPSGVGVSRSPLEFPVVVRSRPEYLEVAHIRPK